MQTYFTKHAIPMFAAIMVSACASTVYTDDNFKDFQATHEEIAIVPFQVVITDTKLPDGIDLETLNAMKMDESLSVQKQLYAQYLKRWSNDEYTVKFQDVDETNVLLRRANMEGDNIRNFTKSEIGQALGVDAVMAGTIRREKPLSTGAAVAVAVITGLYGTTNAVAVNMTIHDSEEGGLLWSYDHNFRGGITNSANNLTRSLIARSSRKFPYRKEDKTESRN